jgi:methylenetetrahydrofolate--tRNA-(uracil-5-)-methyltransferase
MNICFKASRYEDEGSYINAPFTKDEYFNFVELLKKGEKVEIKKTDLGIFFRGCLPIEVMAEEGIETLRFGPMRSDGLIDPRTGKRPYAVIQLRQDDLMATIYNMVGFQTRLKYKEQERIFRTIPGFKNIEFLRLGSMHRNTFINPTKVLKTDMSLINNEKIYIVGQLSGVEGYIESTAQAIAAARSILQKMALPNYTAIGALSSYITSSSVDNFTPMKINFGLLPRLTDEDKIKYMEGKTKFDYKLAQSKKSLSFFVDHFCK